MASLSRWLKTLFHREEPKEVGIIPFTPVEGLVCISARHGGIRGFDQHGKPLTEEECKRYMASTTGVAKNCVEVIERGY